MRIITYYDSRFFAYISIELQNPKVADRIFVQNLLIFPYKIGENHGIKILNHGATQVNLMVAPRMCEMINSNAWYFNFLTACYLSKGYEDNGHCFILARVKVRDAVKFCNWIETDDFKEQKFINQKAWSMPKRL